MVTKNSAPSLYAALFHHPFNNRIHKAIRKVMQAAKIGAIIFESDAHGANDKLTAFYVEKYGLAAPPPPEREDKKKKRTTIATPLEESKNDTEAEIVGLSCIYGRQERHRGDTSGGDG